METPPPPRSRDLSDLETLVLEAIGKHVAPVIDGYDYPPTQRIQMSCEALLAGAAILMSRAEWLVVVGGAEMGFPPSKVAGAVEALERRLILNARRWAEDFKI